LRRPRRVVRVTVPEAHDVEPLRSCLTIRAHDVGRVEVVPVARTLDVEIAGRGDTFDHDRRLFHAAHNHTAALVWIRGRRQLADARVRVRGAGRLGNAHDVRLRYSPL